MRLKKYPILEYDSSRKVIVAPGMFYKKELPEHCVICFFDDVLKKIRRKGEGKLIGHLSSEMGKQPIFEMLINKKRLVVFHSAVGAPMAAGFLEEIIAKGCNKIIACGGAGVLNKEIAVGKIIVPASAVRDEGTSYHYIPPGREVSAGKKGVKAIIKVLEKYKIGHIVGKTWTTDGFYRETLSKIKARKAEGCITVEMEAAAFFAVAKYRKIIFAQMLYGGDDCSGSKWDSRQWNRCSIRERLFRLSCEACLSL